MAYPLLILTLTQFLFKGAYNGHYNNIKENDIDNLRKLCADLEGLAQDMAEASANYDKAIKVRIMELKSEGMPVSICEKVARGDCHKQLLEKELSIALFKIQNTKIECCRASLMGYQSINKNLSEVV